MFSIRYSEEFNKELLNLKTKALWENGEAKYLLKTIASAINKLSFEMEAGI
ncbi:MAG: hypothetical protein NTY48_05015 [Candidatus Diapherotrites archaeon]|nr:hypothetical protein [Candidatus Diapherotrites archaeon]